MNVRRHEDDAVGVVSREIRADGVSSDDGGVLRLGTRAFEDASADRTEPVGLDVRHVWGTYPRPLRCLAPRNARSS